MKILHLPPLSTLEELLAYDPLSGELTRVVHWSKRHNRWVVQITINKKRKWIGTYPALEDAKDAYDIAAKSYFGKFYKGEGL